MAKIAILIGNKPPLEIVENADGSASLHSNTPDGSSWRLMTWQDGSNVTVHRGNSAECGWPLDDEGALAIVKG